MLNVFERKILRRIYGPTQEGCAGVPDGVMNSRRPEWVGHIIRIEKKKNSNKISKRKLPYHKTSGKTKN
jgi:hypothetical protein